MNKFNEILNSKDDILQKRIKLMLYQAQKEKNISSEEPIKLNFEEIINYDMNEIYDKINNYLKAKTTKKEYEDLKEEYKKIKDKLKNTDLEKTNSAQKNIIKQIITLLQIALNITPTFPSVMKGIELDEYFITKIEKLINNNFEKIIIKK